MVKCNYCKKEKIGNSDLIFKRVMTKKININKVHQADLNLWLIEHADGKVYLWSEIGDSNYAFSYVDQTKEIKYCPFCGRKF